MSNQVLIVNRDFWESAFETTDRIRRCRRRWNSSTSSSSGTRSWGNPDFVMENLRYTRAAPRSIDMLAPI